MPTDLAEQAMAFALERHGRQPYGELPYAVHLEAVVQVLARFGCSDPELLAAGWLHDVVEDTEATPVEIEARFGAHVATLVGAVSSEPGRNRSERNRLTYPKIRRRSEAVVLKLADRIANVEHGLEQGSGLVQMYKLCVRQLRSRVVSGSGCCRTVSTT